ncbi:hypothetical protein [Thermodesulfovibrio hydrogeniphilus]
MKKNLFEIMTKIFNNKETGVLSLAFAEESNLFKFYFKDGEIYHVSFGLKKGNPCLKEIEKKEPTSYNFVSNITIDIKSNDLPTTEKIIEYIKNLNKQVSAEEPFSIKSLEFQKIKDSIKIALIRQIGPIGGKILEKYIVEKWTPSNPLTKDDILRLVEMLKDEIEDPLSKREFLAEVNKLLEVYK